MVALMVLASLIQNAPGPTRWTDEARSVLETLAAPGLPGWMLLDPVRAGDLCTWF
jgi:hypothetical protein